MSKLIEGVLYVSQRGNWERVFLWENKSKEEESLLQLGRNVCTGVEAPRRGRACPLFGSMPWRWWSQSEWFDATVIWGSQLPHSMGITELFSLLQSAWDMDRARLTSAQSTCLTSPEGCQTVAPLHSNGQGGFSTEEWDRTLHGKFKGKGKKTRFS